jgi:hypothetical protein
MKSENMFQNNCLTAKYTYFINTIRVDDPSVYHGESDFGNMFDALDSMM